MASIQDYLNSVTKKAQASPAMTYLTSLQPKTNTTTALSTPAVSTKLLPTTPSNPSSTNPIPTTPTTPKATAPTAPPTVTPTTPAAAVTATPAPGSPSANAAPAIGTTPPAATTTTPPPVSTPLSEYLKQYKLNQTALADANKPSAEISAASKSLADINSEIERKRLEGRRRIDASLDRSGGTLGGARDIAANESRRANSELADLAVQQSAAANTLQALTGDREAQIKYAQSLIDTGKAIVVGDSLIDPATGQIIYEDPKATNTDFTLSPGETRFDKDGKVVASGGAKPLTATQEQNILDNQKQATAQQQQATQSLSLVNDLLSGDTSAITGVGQNPLNYLGITNAESINKYNQLTGLLKLGVRGLIKGQGAVSDYEGRILADASSALGRNLPNEAFNQALKNIRGVVKTNSGQTATVAVTDPNTHETIVADLSGPEIYQLVSEGNTVKYQ